MNTFNIVIDKNSFANIDYIFSQLSHYLSTSGIVYDLHFVPESNQDISKILHEVVHYIEENYSWKGTINFRFVHYRNFELRSGK